MILEVVEGVSRVDLTVMLTERAVGVVAAPTCTGAAGMIVAVMVDVGVGGDVGRGGGAVAWVGAGVGVAWGGVVGGGDEKTTGFVGGGLVGGRVSGKGELGRGAGGGCDRGGGGLARLARSSARTDTKK